MTGNIVTISSDIEGRSSWDMNDGCAAQHGHYCHYDCVQDAFAHAYWYKNDRKLVISSKLHSLSRCSIDCTCLDWIGWLIEINFSLTIVSGLQHLIKDLYK